MRKLLPSTFSDGIKVIPPMYGVDYVWFGAMIVCNVSEKVPNIITRFLHQNKVIYG